MDKKDITILVLRFDKSHYDKNDLDNMSDIEKYQVASKENSNCWIYTASEYCDMINGFKPMEKYVWMYIISIPTEKIMNVLK